MADGNDSATTIERIIEAVNERDLGAMAQFVHPEFQRHDLYGGLPEVSGQSGPADLIQLVLQAMPDLHIEIEQSFATDDRVAAHIRISGTHQGELLGVPGSGERVEVDGINIYRFADGKLAETWQLADVWSLLRQVGAVQLMERSA